MTKLTLFLFCAFFNQNAIAVYVPHIEIPNAVATCNQIENLVSQLSAEDFQVVTGKKFNRMQKWQYNKL